MASDERDTQPPPEDREGDAIDRMRSRELLRLLARRQGHVLRELDEVQAVVRLLQLNHSIALQHLHALSQRITLQEAQSAISIPAAYRDRFPETPPPPPPGNGGDEP